MTGKMKKIILLLFAAFVVGAAKGQSFCSTPQTSSNMNLNSNYQMRTSNHNSYCLRVYFHVIRRSNGTGGQTVASVNSAFNFLKYDFRPHNISFSWNNRIDYIDNDYYYDGGGRDSIGERPPEIFSENNHEDGIDIYLYNDFLNGVGRANGVGEASAFFVSGSYWKSPYTPLTRSHVVSHEMGHVLFLWHTHRGSVFERGSIEPGVSCPELVNGSNSSSCGDFVTDTPADPYLGYNVNQTTCQWNSSATDINGDPYDPDEKLIMAYTDITCMRYFSPKQGERMRNAIENLSYLQDVLKPPPPRCVETVNMRLTTYGIGPYGQLDVIVRGGAVAPFKYYMNGRLIKTSYRSSVTLQINCNGGLLKVEAMGHCGTISANKIITRDCRY